jgi:hypothetical protein
MNPIIVGLVLGLFMMTDIVATYLTQRHYRRRYPQSDYKEFELNPFVRFLWGKFGFELGSLLSPIILSPFLIVLIYGSIENINLFFFTCGAYVVVLSLHWANFMAIAEKRQTDFTKMYDRLYGGAK